MVKNEFLTMVGLTVITLIAEYGLLIFIAERW